MSDYTTDIEERFANIELDIPSPKPVTPPRRETQVTPIAGVTIKPEAKAKADAEVALAAKHGIVAEAFFANGTQMLDMGEQRAREHRKAWENQPRARDAAEAVVQAIKFEERRDPEFDLSKARLNPDGMLAHVSKSEVPTRENAKAWHLTDKAYTDIQNRGPGDVLKRNLNAWLGKAGKPAVLRTRRTLKSAQEREVYAVVSERYAALNIDELATNIAQILPADARGRVHYTGYPQPNGTLEFTLAPAWELNGSDISVGRIHRFGIRASSADDGSQAIRISTFAERIACINCTLMQGEGLKVSMRHVGDLERLRNAVKSALAGMDHAAREFSNLWRAGNEAAIHALYDGTPDSARRVFEALVDNEYVTLEGMANSTLTDALCDAWNKEPGDTYAAVHNAVTRAAHEGPWGAGSWQTEELETQASQMLYQRVWALPRWSDTMTAVYNQE